MVTIPDDVKNLVSLEDKVKELTNLVETMAAKSQEDEKERKDLISRLEKQDEVINPQGGPGPACEAYKVHLGEALQLRMSDVAGVYEPVPVGFRVREHDMIKFLVKDDTSDNAPLTEGMVSNCRSLYTEEYEYLLPKRPGQLERQKSRAPLCHKHAKILLSKESPDGNNELKE